MKLFQQNQQKVTIELEGFKKPFKRDFYIVDEFPKIGKSYWSEEGETYLKDGYQDKVILFEFLKSTDKNCPYELCRAVLDQTWLDEEKEPINDVENLYLARRI